MKQIWSSYKEVTREDEYAKKYMGYARERAYSYIKDTVEAVGSLSVMISGKPAIITRFNDAVEVRTGMGEKDKVSLEELPYETLIELCATIHEAHLVREYGESEEETEKEEQQ